MMHFYSGSPMHILSGVDNENKIKPISFKTVVGREGIGFEIRLRTEEEEARFQRAFG